MKKVLLYAVIVTLVFPVLVFGAGQREPVAGEKPLVAFLMPTKEQPIWVSQGEELVELFEQAGYRTRLEFAEDVVERQVAQIENASLVGAKYLVISAVDSFAISDAVEKAKADGATIIANDRLIMNTRAVDFYVTFDLFSVGEMQGRYIEQELGLDRGEQGPFNMEIVSGSPDDPNSQIFYNGAMSILKQYLDKGSLVVRSGQVDFNVTATLGWDGSRAQARMDNLLGAYYTTHRVDAVLSAADCITLGVVSALTSMGYGSANRPFPVVTGQDCELTAIKSIIEGEQSMSVFLDAKMLADKVLEVINTYESGGRPISDTTYDNGMIQVETAIYDPALVDRDNWRIVIDRGLYTEAEILR